MKSCILKGPKQIFDDIHGYIDFTETELRVLEHPLYQRLRNILQLGLTYYIYPGATHTRFSHSIGVKHVIGEMAKTLCQQGFLNMDDLMILRISGMLHDIGHYPFSHALEEVFTKHLNGLSHENLSVKLISETSLKDVLENEGFNYKEIASIITWKSKNKLYNMLLSSDVDSDRLDYLLRDSRHTGVAYGNIDVHRIIATLTLNSKGLLAIMRKGLESVENLYIARLHMYRSVYMHKTVLSFELMLSQIYKTLYEKFGASENIYGPKEINELICNEEFDGFNDHYVFHLLFKFRKDSRLSNLERRIINMILLRKPMKIAFEEHKLSSENIIREKAERLRECLESKIKNKTVHYSTYIYYGNISFFSRKYPMIIVDNSGDEGVPIYGLKNISLLSFLPPSYNVLRVYTLPEYYKYVSNVVKKCLNTEVS